MVSALSIISLLLDFRDFRGAESAADEKKQPQLRLFLSWIFSYDNHVLTDDLHNLFPFNPIIFQKRLGIEGIGQLSLQTQSAAGTEGPGNGAQFTGKPGSWPALFRLEGIMGGGEQD